MAVKLGREEILARLNNEVKEKRPILGAGCSIGVIAKCAEFGKADLIIAYSTGKTRMMGMPTTMLTGPISNEITLGMADELMNIVKNTPIIAGIEANDFSVLRLEDSVRRFIDKGFNGVINFPTVGLYENLIDGGMALRKFNEAMSHGYGETHWGWAREVKMIEILHDMNVFTMSYVLSSSDAKEMAQAGADAVCAHVGPSMGGLTGYAPMDDMDGLLLKAQNIMDAAREVNPEVLCLIHGGPFYDPESTKIVYEKTDAVGFVAASAIERVPVERAVMTVCQEYKKLPMSRL